MEWRSIVMQGGTALKPLAIVSLHASPVAALGAGENGGMNVYVRAVCEELSRRGIPTEGFTRRTSADGPERGRLAEKNWGTPPRVGPPEKGAKGGLFALLPRSTKAGPRAAGSAWSRPASTWTFSAPGRPRRCGPSWAWATQLSSSSPAGSNGSREQRS